MQLSSFAANFIDDKENIQSYSVISSIKPIQDKSFSTETETQKTIIQSPSKQLVKRTGQSITPLGITISLPKNTEVNDPHREDLKYIAFYQARRGVKIPLSLPLYVTQLDPFLMPHPSILLHSKEHRTCLYLVEHIEDAMILDQYIRSINPEIKENEVHAIVKEVMEGFSHAMDCPTAAISTLDDYKKYLDISAILSLPSLKCPLAFLLNTYKEYEDLFKNIAIQDLAGEEAFEKEKNLKTFQDQYIENYSRLITEGIFKDLLLEEYKADLEANKDLYDLTNQWHLIAQTFAATSTISTSDKIIRAEFYNKIAFPFLQKIFFNEKGYYMSVQFFSCNIMQARFNVLKFKINDQVTIPAIVLCALPPIVEKAKPKEIEKITPPKKDNGCVIS